MSRRMPAMLQWSMALWMVRRDLPCQPPHRGNTGEDNLGQLQGEHLPGQAVDREDLPVLLQLSGGTGGGQAPAHMYGGKSLIELFSLMLYFVESYQLHFYI